MYSTAFSMLRKCQKRNNSTTKTKDQWFCHQKYLLISPLCWPGFNYSNIPDPTYQVDRVDTNGCGNKSLNL